MIIFNVVKTKIISLPKWFRFVMFYGTFPLWFPIVFFTLFLLWVVIAPVAFAIEAWNAFK